LAGPDFLYERKQFPPGQPNPRRWRALDWLGGQVDDNRYQIVNDHGVRIGDVTFRYSMASGGQRLMLAPELTSAMITEALADPSQFTSARWAVSVAYAGSTWMRVDCQQWG
jgi:hypothetical protein